MADAITFQVNLGNGALNLGCSEIVKSWTNSQIINSTINDLDWNVLLGVNPQCFTSYIIFREAWNNSSFSRTSDSSSSFIGNTIISLLTGNGDQLSNISTINFNRSQWTGTRYNYYTEALNNGIIFLAK